MLCIVPWHAVPYHAGHGDEKVEKRITNRHREHIISILQISVRFNVYICPILNVSTIVFGPFRVRFGQIFHLVFSFRFMLCENKSGKNKLKSCPSAFHNNNNCRLPSMDLRRSIFIHFELIRFDCRVNSFVFKPFSNEMATKMRWTKCGFAIFLLSAIEPCAI